MPGLFEGYKIVVLDASFFSSSFTQEFKDGLSKTKVYVSSTFNTEIEEYRKVLSEERKKIYSDNFDFINKNVILNTMNFDSTGGKADKLNSDIWGLINLVVDLNKKFNAKIAIVTANRILMNKIILSGIDADYYDLNKQMFTYKSNYASMRNGLAFREVTQTGEQSEVRMTAESTVYLSGNRSQVLGEEITSGLEATIFSVKNDASQIIKVFKKDKLSASKLKNIHNIAGINNDLKISWAYFPKEVVYSDVACKCPIGFSEEFVSTGVNLDDNPLYWGDPLSVEDEYLNKKISYGVDLCLKVVRQVCYLNSYGFYISDYNMGNFSMSKLSSDVIQMWDTDSFGYQNFFGKCFSPEYQEAKSHSPYDISNKEGAISISEDALHQFVFKVLALGDSPISEFKKTFKYDDKDYPNVMRASFFPFNVWSYLTDVFRGNKEPSPEMLLYELSVALKRLKQYPNEDKTVKQLFVDAFPGYIEALNASAMPASEPEPVKSSSTVQTSGNPTGSNSTNTQQVKKEKHPIKTVIKILLCIIICYCSYAWFAWHQLPWETDAWKAIFQQGVPTELKIEETETPQETKTSQENDVARECTIAMNVKKVVLKVGEEKEYQVTCKGDVPDKFSFYFDDEDIDADIEWLDWVDNYTASIRIKANSQSTGYIRLYLYEEEKDTTLAYVDVPVEIGL